MRFEPTARRAWRASLVPVAFGCVCVLSQSCSHEAEPASAAPPANNPSCVERLVTHARLHASPDGPVLEDAAIRIRDGRFVEIAAPSSSVASPPVEGCTLDVGGRAVTAGFWNAHVHHMDPAFQHDDTAGPLLSEMFLSRGFTSVVDTGADWRVLSRLQQSIAAGTLVGPRIVVFGGGFVPKDGTPSYLPKGLLPEIAQPADAAPLVNAALDRGANGIKIFSGSFQTPTSSLYLAPEIIAAVTQTAHARGAFVATHPTDRRSLLAAVDNGVDVVAHTVPPAGKLEADLLARMHARNIALIPTLKLWKWELTRDGVPPSIVQSYEDAGVAQLHDYHAIDGEILFGTDVGYMTDYDTTDEIRAMASAGLDYRAILASLTTAPAKRFGGAASTVSVGEVGDLVVFDDDPAQDVTVFARPAMTIRGGQIVYTRP